MRSLDVRAVSTKPSMRLVCHSAFMLLAVGATLGFRELPPPPMLIRSDITTALEYLIRPLETAQIFVRHAPEFSATVPVRPDDGAIVQLTEDLEAARKSSSVNAHDAKEALRPFMRESEVSVMVEGGTIQKTQIVMGNDDVVRPTRMQYQTHTGVVDVMADAQRWTAFADGKDAKLISKAIGRKQNYQLKLNDLLNDSHVSANAKLRPGDLIVGPKSLL